MFLALKLIHGDFVWVYQKIEWYNASKKIIHKFWSCFSHSIIGYMFHRDNWWRWMMRNCKIMIFGNLLFFWRCVRFSMKNNTVIWLYLINSKYKCLKPRSKQYNQIIILVRMSLKLVEEVQLILLNKLLIILYLKLC